MTYFTTSGVISTDVKIHSYTHRYGPNPTILITSADIGRDGSVHFQGDPDVMLAFVDRLREALVESIAAFHATEAEATVDA